VPSPEKIDSAVWVVVPAVILAWGKIHGNGLCPRIKRIEPALRCGGKYQIPQRILFYMNERGIGRYRSRFRSINSDGMENFLFIAGNI
jgi:hypothetical protein